MVLAHAVEIVKSISSAAVHYVTWVLFCIFYISNVMCWVAILSEFGFASNRNCALQTHLVDIRGSLGM